MSETDRDLLEIYKQQLELSLNWDTSADWANSDFNKLSELVFQKTSVRLSVSTLKRLFGKIKYDSAPSATTLNTLAQFLDYPDWRDFTRANNQHLSKAVITGHHTPPMAILQKPRFKFAKGLVAASLIVCIAGAIITAFVNKKKNINPAQVHFESKVLTNDLPNSVVFNYDIGDYKTDSVIIQQSWDPGRRETVSAKNHSHTSLYYYPGYFRAKLLVNNQVVKEQDVLIKTKGWEGIIYQKPVPLYLTSADINLDANQMGISPELLQQKIENNNFNDCWTNFYRVNDSNTVNIDSFNLSLNLQNTSTKEESACRKVQVIVFSAGGYIVIPLSTKGCTSDLDVELNGTMVNGKENDLASLGCDFSKPQDFKCVVKNKMIAIYLNGVSAFTYPATLLSSKILGVVIGFEGAGKFSGFTLR